MSTQDLTVAEFQAAEDRRKAKATITKSAVPVGASLDDAFKRLATTMKEHPIVDLQSVAEKDQALRTAQLRTTWGAPKRHMETEVSEDCGPWWKKFLLLNTRLNSGFLIALVGQRGPGKTQMGVELMKLQTQQNRTALYCCAMDYFIALRDTFDHERGKPNQAKVINEFAAPSLLVIDEAQERAETPFEDRLLTHLLNRRYNAMKDTLLISNQSKGEFLAAIGPSAASRLEETGGVITCDWPSFRKINHQ